MSVTTNFQCLLSWLLHVHEWKEARFSVTNLKSADVLAST